IRRIREHRAVILMYHRICEPRDDPWELAVHPNHFEAHLSWLKNNFEVIPVSEMIRRIGNGGLHRTVALTFDDGLKDNYNNAAPLLDWHALPATFYLATSAMRAGYVYWWDTLLDLIFHTRVLP